MTRICKEDLERNFNLRSIDEQKPRTRNEAKLYNLESEYCYSIGEITAKLRSLRKCLLSAQSLSKIKFWLRLV